MHVVDDLSTGRIDNLAAGLDDPRLRVTIASVEDPAVAARVCADADAVFHLAGVVGVQRLAAEPLAVMQCNLHSTQCMVAAAAAARVGILLTSSSEVYGDGRVPFREQDPVRPGATEGLRGGYACAKAMGEWLAFGHAEQSGLPVVVARLFNTVGPRQTGDHGMVLPRFVTQALRGEPLTVYGDGSQTRCFAHVGEVVRALADLAEARGAAGRVFNVGSAVGRPRLLELAELVRAGACSAFADHVRVPFDAVFPSRLRRSGPRRVAVRSTACVRRLVGCRAASIESIVAELARVGRRRGASSAPLRCC